MRRGRATGFVALAALGGQLTAGCGAAGPYVERDPAGSCLQLPSHRFGKGHVSTLWRGDTFVGNVGTGGEGLDAAVVGATTDNPAANAEALAGRRVHRAAVALIYGQPLGAIAVGVAGAFATHHSQSDSVIIPIWIGAFAAELSMLAGGLHLESSSYAHARKAIAIYNTNPPPGCGSPAQPP
jgi:hypothetical protein